MTSILVNKAPFLLAILVARWLHFLQNFENATATIVNYVQPHQKSWASMRLGSYNYCTTPSVRMFSASATRTVYQMRQGTENRMNRSSFSSRQPRCYLVAKHPNPMVDDGGVRILKYSHRIAPLLIVQFVNRISTAIYTSTGSCTVTVVRAFLTQRIAHAGHVLPNQCLNVVRDCGPAVFSCHIVHARKVFASQLRGTVVQSLPPIAVLQL